MKHEHLDTICMSWICQRVMRFRTLRHICGPVRINSVKISDILRVFYESFYERASYQIQINKRIATNDATRKGSVAKILVPYERLPLI